MLIEPHAGNRMLHEPLNCWNEKVVMPSETTVSPVTLSVLAIVTIR